MQRIVRVVFTFTLCVVCAVSAVWAQDEEIILHAAAWEDYVMPDLADKFTEEYYEKTGKVVRVVQDVNVGTNDELLELTRSGKFDLVAPTCGIVEQYINEGLVIPIDLDKVPNYSQINPLLQYTSVLSRNGDNYGVAFDFGADIAAYNGDYFPVPPDSWQVFLDKKFKGKIVMWDDATFTIWMACVFLGFQDDYFNLSDDQLSKVKEKLVEIDDQVGAYWSTSEEAANLFETGSYALASSWGIEVQYLRNRGRMNFHVFSPKEQSTAWFDSWMITKFCKHVEEAHAWINFAISIPYQKDFADRNGTPPSNSYTAPLFSSERMRELHLNDLGYFYRMRLMRTMPRRSVYLAVWDEIRKRGGKPSAKEVLGR